MNQRIPSEAEWAWVAGLFEGEGTVFADGTQKTKRVLAIVMTDKDVIEHAAFVFGTGNVTGPYANGGHSRKPVYRWKTAKLSEVKRICKEMEPWLGERRRTKMQEIGLLDD